ncbi:MAG: preprotein translocase subunit SecA [Candidatus Marinimicrobia bacterium CG08_land_8_20_14_0_20_45_22]|nr:MAG: preprotein translocase subunit SecA [Candidatus Marinimicrobia bacterium CG08_land_8_20_14_0_20_45_22]
MSISSFLTSIFGTASDREIKKIQPVVDEINQIYSTLQDVPIEKLRKRTEEFKRFVQESRSSADKELPEDMDREERDKILLKAERAALDEILPEAFAMVKDVCRRLVGQEWIITDQKMKWDMVPYDVQLIGAVVLHEGKIAEMKTGEGKTLVATMPVYLNALTGRGVHVVTVNDYLAQRDSEWMGRIYTELGLTVGCILNTMDSEARRHEYSKDITYGTNNEFGFDYLRDNMALSVEEQVQRGYFYAIVDEVDNILIDEARTPLIISGPVAASRHEKFDVLNPAVASLVRYQRDVVTEILSRFPDDPAQLKDDAALASKFYVASQGMPKNRRLRKLLEEPEYQKLAQSGEREYLLLTGGKTGQSVSQDEYFKDLYYYIEEKQHNITLTPKGEEKLASLLGINVNELIIPEMAEKTVEIDTDATLSETEKEKKKLELDMIHSEISDRFHNISQLLRAYSLYEKDNEYVVQDGRVLIVDEFTGRILPGRRYSDGLHQAIEAKEKVKVEAETQTFATITLQNYFRMYDKLAGMTGTAETESAEFLDIYKLNVVVVPTNETCIRTDHEDQVYKTRREKYNAIINEIEAAFHKGQPVLVGTISVEVSETISRMLKRRGIPHNVLNAKQHKREAEIVARAGEKSAVTIATNMAGRGTDIKLGKEVRELGGLYIVGTERHESRRIDLQLRGRSGRQGDPGESRFFLSLEDDLMRLFNSERVAAIMDKIGIEEGQVITHSMVTRSIERAQKKVEERNFGIRKHLLEYDNVMNHQREIIYDRRNYALVEPNLRSEVFSMLDEWTDGLVEKYTSDSAPDEWDWNELRMEIGSTLGIDMSLDQLSNVTPDGIKSEIIERSKKYYDRREKYLGEEQIRFLEKFVILRTIDEKWRDHLYSMDQLKEGINWRAYGQKDPLLEYKSEGYTAFTIMLDEVNKQALKLCFRAQIGGPAPEQHPARRAPTQAVHRESLGMGFTASNETSERSDTRGQKQMPIHVEKHIGRNDPCPCGSGKKYKKCHGANL